MNRNLKLFFISIAVSTFIVIFSHIVDVSRHRVISLELAGTKVLAEVSDTVKLQSAGLSFRFYLPENLGMLFVFDETDIKRFWMVNTFIPLSVAFIDAGGRVLNIEKMSPFSDDIHRSVAPAKFALEMNSDWFTRRNVKSGDFVTGLPL